MTEAPYVALLRGINVGGHAKVAMADLRDLLAGLDLRDVRTLLQSGNVVFRADDVAAADLEHLLEQETAQRLGFCPDYLVRTADEWADVVARNPFAAEAERDPSHLLVMFLKQAPSAAAVAALQAAITGPEVVHAEGRHAYVTYPEGIGRSRLTGTLIESKLGTRGTGRNWNTVLKLAALVGG
ncbi:MAG TPA: DUF1697 domain-containing protein [Chloroflexota bacterium]|nr:DUF1697 domain-containing protein [Chloroflexota bacterium]